MANEGSGCKNKDNFCHICEVPSGEHDLLLFVTRNEVCEMCTCNNRVTCAHRDVNDVSEVRRKGEKLLNHLRDSFAWLSGISNATFKDMIPNEEGDCYAGYDDDGVRVTEGVNLSHFVTDDESKLTRPRLCI